MKLNPIKTSNWSGTPAFAEAQRLAIEKANREGTGYDVVRTLQQVAMLATGVAPLRVLLDKVNKHIDDWKDCQKCRLGQCPFVINKCFYRGYIPCDVLFIGEAPGQNEDTHARPFVGEAGRRLDEIIKDTSRRITPLVVADGTSDKVAQAAYDKWYAKDNNFRWCVTNTVLCLPYDQGSFREPEKDEVEACSPRLLEFITLASPKLIVIMGLVANRALQRYRDLPPTVYIPHPSWFNRLKNSVERETEQKKVVLNIVAAFNKHIVPF